MGIGIDYPKVDQKDLRVGDAIFPYSSDRETIGEEVLQVGDSDGDVETKYGYYDPERYDFYLIKRAPFVLPTKKGSVVKVSNESVSANWFLRQDGKWHSEDVSVRSADEFQRFVAQFKAEVIA